ncbi:TPA: hypothetical protein ACH3X2_012035 [Trebouxia sp. C0005]
MFPIDILRWPGGTREKSLEKSEVRLCASEQGSQCSYLRYIGHIFDTLQAFERKENGFAKTEIAVVTAFWQQKRLQRFLEPSHKAMKELNKEKLLLESTCRHFGYTGAPEEPAEYLAGATEEQKQNLQKYVTAAQQLWSKVQGRTHAHEHMLKVLAIRLWNQLGVLQEERFPQEVELDAADADFLAAMLDVIEAYGQSQKVLMGIAVDDADKKRRDEQDQEIACLQTCIQQSREDAECRAAAVLEEKNRLLGQVFDLEQQTKQLQEDKQQLQEIKEHLQKGVNDTAKCIKEIARLQADNQSTQQSREDAECRAAATLEEKNKLLGQVFDLEQQKKQLQEDKEHMQGRVNDTAKCIKENSRLQAENQSTQQSWKHAQCGAAAVQHVNRTLQAQVFSLQADKTQLQEEKGQLQEDLRHTATCMKENEHLQAKTQMQEQRQAADDAETAIEEEMQQDLDDSAAQPQMSKAAKKQAKKQRKAAMQETAVMDQDQVVDVNKWWQVAQDTCKDYQGKAEQARSIRAAHMKELQEENEWLKARMQKQRQSADNAETVIKEKVQQMREKAKKQRKAATQVTAVTAASPEAPSPMVDAGSAPGPTSGAELQVPSIPSRSSLAADVGTQSPAPTSDIAAAPKLTKSQKKKAKKQQKSAVQLTELSLDVPSAMDGASSAPATTLGAELQVPSIPCGGADDAKWLWLDHLCIPKKTGKGELQQSAGSS